MDQESLDQDQINQYERDQNNEDDNIKEFQPSLITKNKGKVGHFRRFGLLLLSWKVTKKYEANQAKLFIYYILWYAVEIGCFAIAYAFKEYFKSANYKDRVDDFIEASFIVVLIGMFPAFWIYLLREYNTNMPQILMMAKRIETNKIYQTLEKLESTSKYSIAEISYKEGWTDEQHNDSEDELNQKTQDAIDKQWRLVKYGPLTGILVSIAVCMLLIIFSIIKDISGIISEKDDDSIDSLKKEVPHFIMAIIYPVPYFVSTWFCIFFLEWQRKLYECFRRLIRKNKISKTEEDLKDLKGIISDVQKAFILLNKKIFQKTIGINFTLCMFLGIFCCWKVLQAASNFAYVIPLALSTGHIYLACKWSNDLMNEYNETIEVLNEMDGDEDVNKLLAQLNNCPPQVLAFGGFPVNYSMMTAVIAFIISCIGIPEEMWPEDNQNCYAYDTGSGKWDQKLCIKNKLFMGINETHCLMKQ